MREITVHLGERSYAIQIVHHDLDRLTQFLHTEYRYSTWFVVTNESIFSLYANELKQLTADKRYHFILIPDGESHKTLDTVDKVYTELIQRNADRNAVIVGLGGGVIGDLAGFVAATYMRGIPLIQVPTTLLAMVDSSVGGKVGVNHTLGKNLIGAFYQPRCVIADTRFLETLPSRELLAGLSEIIKYGLIADVELFEWASEHWEKFLACEPETLEKAVTRSCEIKAVVVERDEMEGSLRMILNFGHTWAHAFESLSDYLLFSHGEAVMMGMMGGTKLSHLRGYLDDSDHGLIQSTLNAIAARMVTPEMKLFFDKITWDEFDHQTRIDKKASGGRVKWVLLNQIGQASVESVPPEMAEEAFNFLKYTIASFE
ncbi:MAG: 3-dehydroquinate synthase [Bacteroidetes bacterium]|nr:3-dehydroquinate synthase [Bacteroidota bacterium]